MVKKATPKVAAKMIKAEKAIENKTTGKPKPAAEKALEKAISKQIGKPYKGKR